VPFWIPWTALWVIALLASEYVESRAGVWVAKPLASAGFVALGLGMGASPVVIAALVLCWVGDVCLILRESKAAFLIGLAAFLCGHLAYTAAFALRGVDWPGTVGAAAGLSLPCLLVAGWLLPEVPPKMVRPVLAYMIVITTMLATSIGLGAHSGAWVVPLAAFLFYLSDLTVARQRFVAPGFLNKALGLPLYYAAQLLFAATL